MLLYYHYNHDIINAINAINAARNLCGKGKLEISLICPFLKLLYLFNFNSFNTSNNTLAWLMLLSFAA